jgi:hypothetical protein
MLVQIRFLSGGILVSPVSAADWLKGRKKKK